MDKIAECFKTIKSEIFTGALNIKTLECLENYDFIVIISKVFKSHIYIEDDNLKSNLLTPLDICRAIPNDEIPIVFITDEKIDLIEGYFTIHISALKTHLVKKFIFKALKDNKLDFKETEIGVYLNHFFNKPVLNGDANVKSIYNNNRDLDIGKKCLKNITGRFEEQATIASKVINIIRTNKLLNIKGSGGIGKTSLIKKVAYELYNRGYFKEGVNFKSCENVKVYEDFEEILMQGFHLTNILDFKGYLIDNYSNNKLDVLIILDNFETVVNSLTKRDEMNKVIDLLRFATDYSNIVVTSREKISYEDDLEDIYSLPHLNTEDALVLFQNFYGQISNENDIKILRQDILEDLLNNNPLAIKLVTKSRTKQRILDLKQQLQKHFFESTTEEYKIAFSKDVDLNIERTKSIYHSINYSYVTLNHREKIAFELLSLFPDGISLTNFKKCFSKNKSKQQISDIELKNLKDKSLIEDNNSILQLQPIIRRFADYKFNKREVDIKKKYCLDAYTYNCFMLKVLETIDKRRSYSEALKFFNIFKNNFFNIINYIPNIEILNNDGILEKKFSLNYIFEIRDYIFNSKQIEEFRDILEEIKGYFSDVPNAKILIETIGMTLIYFHEEFDDSYQRMSEIFSYKDMEIRIIANEDYLEKRYKDLISGIHSMEGHSITMVSTCVENNNISRNLDVHFFYLGIVDTLGRWQKTFYDYEYALMFNKLDINDLEKYIQSLYSEEHLEIMQSTYTLSKVKTLDKKTIQKLVVTNPYTKGLKNLMFAFISTSNEEKQSFFQEALLNLYHIKYYYLEALYYYCLYLKENNIEEFNIKVDEGLDLSNKFYYQYLSYLFKNLKYELSEEYIFSYAFYPIPNLQEFVKKHNDEWEESLKQYEKD